MRALAHATLGAVCTLLLIGTGACRSSTQTTRALTAVDAAAIRAVDSAYVAAWLRDDTAGVLSTLAPDVVIMPAGGRPLVDSAAIRTFWWPQDGSHTTILTFASTLDELAGTGDLAYTRGRNSLTFTYAKGGTVLRRSTPTMALTVYAKGADGRWRIARKMWGPLGT